VLEPSHQNRSTRYIDTALRRIISLCSLRLLGGVSGIGGRLAVGSALVGGLLGRSLVGHGSRLCGLGISYGIYRHRSPLVTKRQHLPYSYIGFKPEYFSKK
jgi:hypothetical protein